MESMSIGEFLNSQVMTGSFKPYSTYSRMADALTFYFKPDRDYSKRLTEHVTLYLSVETNEIIGCRIKNISGIIEDLPNYIAIDHDGQKLKFIFMAQRGAAGDNEDARLALNTLARQADDVKLELVA